MGCLNDLLMYVVVAPGLAVLLAIAVISGSPALILGAVVLCIVTFGLYLLAMWDE